MRTHSLIHRSGNYLLLTGRHIYHYLIERIMPLQQIIDKKDTFSLIQSILSSFNPGRILSQARLPAAVKGNEPALLPGWTHEFAIVTYHQSYCCPLKSSRQLINLSGADFKWRMQRCWLMWRAIVLQSLLSLKI